MLLKKDDSGARTRWKIGAGGILLTLVILFLGFNLFAQEQAQEFYRNGYIYFSQGQFERALEMYQAALEADPEFLEAAYWLGKTYEQLGDLRSAFEQWTLVLLAQPANRDAFSKWREYAASLVRLSDQEEERIRQKFLEGADIAFTAQEAWNKVLPYAFSLLNRSDLNSLLLAGRIFSWGRERVSYLLAPYQRLAYQRALDTWLVSEESYPADSFSTYQFLQEVQEMVGEDFWQEKEPAVRNKLFAQQAGVSLEEASNIEKLEFTISPETITKETTQSGLLPGQRTPQFYLEEEE